MHIGRSTYLQCPKSLSGSVTQPQSHLQDRVRRLLGGNIAGKSRKYKARGGLPVRLLRAREGLTFIAALLHKPNHRGKKASKTPQKFTSPLHWLLITTQPYFHCYHVCSSPSVTCESIFSPCWQFSWVFSHVLQYWA